MVLRNRGTRRPSSAGPPLLIFPVVFPGSGFLNWQAPESPCTRVRAAPFSGKSARGGQLARPALPPRLDVLFRQVESIARLDATPKGTVRHIVSSMGLT